MRRLDKALLSLLWDSHTSAGGSSEEEFALAFSAALFLLELWRKLDAGQSSGESGELALKISMLNGSLNNEESKRGGSGREGIRIMPSIAALLKTLRQPGRSLVSSDDVVITIVGF